MKSETMLIDELEKDLTERGCKFDKNGFPVLSESFFAEKEPDFIVPYEQRGFSEPKNTSICFIGEYEFLYSFFEKIDEIAAELQSYQSACWMDLPVDKDMPRTSQKTKMLLNALFSASLAYRGIKILPSLRCGDEQSLSFIEPNKKAPIMFLNMSGHPSHTEIDPYDEFITRCAYIIMYPKRLLIYGKPSQEEDELLYDIGFYYRVYEEKSTVKKKDVAQGGDFHSFRKASPNEGKSLNQPCEKQTTTKYNYDLPSYLVIPKTLENGPPMFTDEVDNVDVVVLTHDEFRLLEDTWVLIDINEATDLYLSAYEEEEIPYDKLDIAIEIAERDKLEEDNPSKVAVIEKFIGALRHAKEMKTLLACNFF